jgi:hypothetical protein
MSIYRDIFKNGRTLKAQGVKDLWDRHFRKPKQDVNLAGGIVHAHVRDPYLALLPKEALEALARSYDEVLAKYALQDSPGNQAVIKPAIEAELVRKRSRMPFPSHCRCCVLRKRRPISPMLAPGSPSVPRAFSFCRLERRTERPQHGQDRPILPRRRFGRSGRLKTKELRPGAFASQTSLAQQIRLCQ